MDIEFEQTLGDTVGQGSLVFCSPWGREDSDMTERLRNNFWSFYSASLMYYLFFNITLF